MKPDKIHVFRNENIPEIPTKPAFDDLTTRVAMQLATPWWSHWLTYAGGGAAVVAGIVGVASYQSTSPAAQVPKPKTEIVMQPAPLLYPFDTITVDVLRGDTILFRGCSKIIIPPGSIQKHNGEPITGTTRILYRELRHAEEIAASGFSLNTAGNGRATLLESNGLLEVRVLENQKIKPGSPLKIVFCTNQIKTGNSWYAYGENNAIWQLNRPAVYQSKPGGMVSQVSAEEDNVVESTPRIARNPGLVPPRLKDPKAHAFHVDAAYVPELAPYKDIVFEVLPGQKYDPSSLPDEFDQIKVKTTPRLGIYLISLYDNGTVYQYYAAPVFENEADYQRAMETYKKAIYSHLDNSAMDIVVKSPKAVLQPARTDGPILLNKCDLLVKQFGAFQVAGTKPTKN
jgi:hypothetical protein